MPLDPHPRAANQDPRTYDLQIDPYRGAALYQLLQSTAPTRGPIEVGFAYVTGSSRLDSTEHWFLYASADDQAVRSNKGAYTWPTGAPEPVGLHFQFVRVDPDLDPVKYKEILEEGSGVTVVYIKATCTPGM